MKGVWRLVVAVTIAGGSVVGLSGCFGNPCATVPPPGPGAVELVKQGYEVERVGQRGAECELTPGGAWIKDAD